MTILAAQRWKTNGELIADVARLGYIGKWVRDVTYGEGTFWSEWRPPILIASDILSVGYVRGVLRWAADFTALPDPPDQFDTVVFDPPYKLNGTPSEPDVRYGVHKPATWQERHSLIRDGLIECVRVLKPGGTLLLKCQDQVCSGKVRWQTRIFANYAEGLGMELVDRFDMLGHHRPQPSGRRQIHAHGRPSTLLVFRKAQ